MGTAGDGQSITLSDIKVPANGYAFIYLSNSSNIPVYFDEFWVTHKRGRILQENHYYPYGLQIASISSKAAGKMDNMYRYQGAYSEFEEETGWNDFELRTYDAQIGRWTGVDPYDQFASGYVGMGNNPANSIDPSGGNIFSSFSNWVASYPVASQAATTLAGGAIGAFSALITGGNVEQGAKWGAGIGLAAGIAGGLDYQAIGGVIGNAGSWVGKEARIIFGSGGEWLPFYKMDLIRYAQTNNENILGKVFENIFEDYMRTANPAHAANAKFLNFRRNDAVWTEGNGRNSKPDFTADGISRNGERILEASAYEIKQNNGRGIYLSSNNSQIRGHISNLAARQAYNMSQGYQPDFTLITTYDVKYSTAIYRAAGEAKIRYIHSRSQYKIEKGGKYKFRFEEIGFIKGLFDF